MTNANGSLYTWLFEQFGCRVPVVCAPMAGAAAGRLASAVSTAGGLGMVGVGHTATRKWITEQCGIAATDSARFGVGLMAWVLDENASQIEAVLDANPALVSVSYGPYAKFVATFQDAGIRVATQIGNLEEARTAEQNGVDVIVARGGEGGGHGRNDVGTLALLQMVLDTVDTPVLAAGGIMTPRGVAAVIAAGAVGAWVGTAFLACIEAETSPAARQRLFAATDVDTAYGRVFDIAQGLRWPREYGGRALRNSFFDRWASREDDLHDNKDAANELRSAREHEDFDTAYIYAGQGVAMLDKERSAAEVVANLGKAQ